METMRKRLSAVRAATAAIRPALMRFYEALNQGQKVRFAGDKLGDRSGRQRETRRESRGRRRATNRATTCPPFAARSTTSRRGAIGALYRGIAAAETKENRLRTVCQT